MATSFVKPANVVRKNHQLDAKTMVLGDLCVAITVFLMGKNKTDYSPHVDMGDFVEVLNPEKFKVTANKRETKLYRRYTGFQGGLKTRRLKEMVPEEVIKIGVLGMLPKNTLRARRIKRLTFVSNKK